MTRLLLLMLIMLKDAGQTTGQTCTVGCSLYTNCYCVENEGLISVPQDLPTTLTALHLRNNVITTLSQSDFSRYSSLTDLFLHFNQISVIKIGAFYGLTSLIFLLLDNNQLTSLRADMFLGLDNLEELLVRYNNIHSIEAGTFNILPRVNYLAHQNNKVNTIAADAFTNLRQLRYIWLQYNNISIIQADAFVNLDQLETLYLDHNQINTFPVEALSNLNSAVLSDLTLYISYNQMETLPSRAYDILASISTVYIGDNPWQCDCRMLPFKRRMTWSYHFESQITCAGPASPVNLTGLSLLRDVNLEDLICEEPTTVLSTSSMPGDSYSISQLVLSGFIGAVIGTLLISAVFLAIWCHHRSRTSPAPAELSVTYNSRDSAVTVTTSTSGDVAGRSGSSRPITAHDPDPFDLDRGYKLVRPPTT